MRSKKAYLLPVFTAILLFTSRAQTPLPATKDVISVEKNAGLERFLRDNRFDLLMAWENRIYALAGPEEFEILSRHNVPFRFETHRFSPPDAARTLLQGGMNGDYHSYLELERDLKILEETHPQLAKVYVLGSSLEGRKIYAIKISDNVSADEPEAELAFLGCHHAREWISVEVPFLLARHLLEHYSDPAVRSIVDRSEVWIVPLVNPDGLEYSINQYRYWRKNRRQNADGSYGVDLNRNYGLNWGYDDIGSSPNPASEVYRGMAAFSEPETQAVRDLFLERPFRAMISFHSFSQTILYPWGFTENPSDRDGLLTGIASAMSQRMQQVNGRVYEFGRAGSSLYLTNGDAADWSFGTSGIPSYTIELPPVDELRGGFFNAETEILPIFRENLPAMLYLIEWAAQDDSPGLNVSGGKKPGAPAAAGRRSAKKD